MAQTVSQPAVYANGLMTFIVNNQEIIQIYLYTILTL